MRAHPPCKFTSLLHRAKLESKIYSKDRHSLILTILTFSYLIKNQQNYEIFQ